MAKEIQIFSERCSGSNYMEQFIRANFPDVRLSWKSGWKHWIPEKPIRGNDDLLFLIVCRQPFEWLRSIHRTPWHVAPPLRGLEFSEFIRSEWWCVYDEHARID
jgi:hypothetical protein